MRKGAYLLALALLAAGVLKPTVERPARGIDYLFVFDLSLSMATEDYTADGLPRSRLDAAKEAFRHTLASLPPESRISIGGFAGQSLQVFLLAEPIVEREAIEDALFVLEWDNVWEVGSRLDRVVRDVAIKMRESRVFTAYSSQVMFDAPLNVVIFTDGGGDDVRPRVGDDAAVWLREQARITFVGTGRTTPSTVPEPKRSAARDCLRTETGECLVSRLNEGNLEGLARHLNGRYVRLDDPEPIASALSADPLRGAETRVPVEVGWIFGLGSLVAFLAWVLI